MGKVRPHMSALPAIGPAEAGQLLILIPEQTPIPLDSLGSSVQASAPAESFTSVLTQKELHMSKTMGYRLAVGTLLLIVVGFGYRSVQAPLSVLAQSKRGGKAPVGTNGLYPGEIRAFAGSSCPATWLVADGRELSDAQYPQLVGVIGDLWGTSAQGKFKLPDLRGMFLRGWNNGRGDGDPDAKGRTIPPGAPISGAQGDQLGTSQADDFKSHGHKTNATARWGDKYADTIGFSADNGTYPGGANTNLPTDAAGGSETRPKNVYVLYCIKQ